MCTIYSPYFQLHPTSNIPHETKKNVTILYVHLRALLSQNNMIQFDS